MEPIEGYVFEGWEIAVFMVWVIFVIGYPFVFAHDLSKVFGSSRIKPDCAACRADNSRSEHAWGLLITGAFLIGLTVWMINLSRP